MSCLGVHVRPMCGMGVRARHADGGGRSCGGPLVVTDGPLVQEPDGGDGLPTDDPVAEGAEHGGAGESGGVGDPAVREAHEPFGEDGAQSPQSVGWPGGSSSEDCFPSADGGSVIAPVKVGLPRP